MADKINISIRLTPPQRAAIDAAAARVGLRAGQWMRQVSLERAAEQAERGARTMGSYTTRRDLEREVSGRVRSYCQAAEDSGRLDGWIERLTAVAWVEGVRSETTLDEWLGYATGGRCARLDALAIEADSEDDGEARGQGGR